MMGKRSALDDALKAIMQARNKYVTLTVQAPLDDQDAAKDVLNSLAEAYILINGMIKEKAQRRDRYAAAKRGETSND